MRKRICWLLFLSVSIQLSQAQGNSAKTGECTITVWMKNPISKEIIADINPISLAKRPALRIQRKMLLDNKNKATLKIPLNGPSVVKLMNACKDSTVSYVALPGVDLVTHLDGLGEETTNYNDTGTMENNFYRDVLTKSNELLEAIPQQDPELFLKTWEQEYKATQELVTAASSDMSPSYVSWISQSITSLFQSKLCRQLVTYVTMSREWPVNLEEYTNKVSSFTTAQFNQPGFFNRETDKELVESYYLFYSLIEDKKQQLAAPNAEMTYRNAINYAKGVKAESSLDLMLRYLVTSATAHTTDTNFLKWMKSTIVFSKQNEHLRNLIDSKQSLLRELGKDKPAPHFDASDISGNNFSYRTYQGKYLYIDIWATWCVPCRKEIPYLEKLKQKYEGQSIEFISVSIDENINSWKKFVESTDNKDQFHSLPGNAASINEVYNAALIPAFVLIDPQGKIVNPATFRPSDPALVFLLDDLLQKNNGQLIQ